VEKGDWVGPPTLPEDTREDGRERSRQTQPPVGYGGTDLAPLGRSPDLPEVVPNRGGASYPV
jgi:hypothetical protein